MSAKPRPRPLDGAPRTMADNRAGLGADPDVRRGQRVAHPRPLDADSTRRSGREPGDRRAQRPGDRGPPLQQSERRPETGVFQRRFDRGHHDRAVAGSRDLRVLARNTTFQYKGKAVDVPKLGRELGVRYVLEGSVRRTDDRLRVTAQLIDTETGAHIWADRFDREMADIFLVQDEIVSQIVAKIAGGITVSSRLPRPSRPRARVPSEIQAYDLVLRAHDVMCRSGTTKTFALRKSCCARRSRSIPRTRGRAASWPGLR